MAGRILDTKLSASIPRQVLPALDLTHSQHLITEKFPSRRFPVKGPQTFTPGGTNIIKIPLGGNAHADLLSHKLYMDVTIQGNASAADELYIPMTAMGMFNRCVITSRGLPIVDISNFDKLNQLFSLSLSTDYKQSHPWEGYNSSHKTAAAISGGDDIYTYTAGPPVQLQARMQGHLLLSGFMALDYLVPLGHLDLELELHISPRVGRSVKCDVDTNVALTVENVELVMDTYKVTAEYDMAVNKAVAERRMRYKYETFWGQIQTLSSSSLVVNINQNYQSLTGIMGSFIHSDCLTDTQSEVLFRAGDVSVASNNGYLNQIDLSIGNKDFIKQYRKAGTRDFAEFRDRSLEFFHNFRDYDSGWSQDNAEWYPSTAFVWGWDLARLGDGYGIDTRGQVFIDLTFNFDSNPTGANGVDRIVYFLRYHRMLILAPQANEIADQWTYEDQRSETQEELESGTGLVRESLPAERGLSYSGGA